MRTATLGIALLGLVAGLTRSGNARACGATPEPIYLVDTAGPTSTDAPLNTPLFVNLREDPTVEPEEDQGRSPTLILTVEGTDEALAVKTPGAGPEEVWIPVEPLEPETTYQVRYNVGYAGAPDTSWTFTTGTETRAALSLEGELEVTFEPGTQTLSQCPQGACPCGCSAEEQAAMCTETEVPVTNARVKLPRVIGGFSRRGGAVVLTDEKPYVLRPAKDAEPYSHAVQVSRQVDLDDPEVVDVLIPLPEAETAYHPCFVFLANDARRDEATVQLCLEESLPATGGTNTTSGGSGNFPATPDNGNDVVRSSETSKGCNVGNASPSRGASGWLALLGLVSVAQRRRRRHA